MEIHKGRKIWKRKIETVERKKERNTETEKQRRNLPQGTVTQRWFGKCLSLNF